MLAVIAANWQAPYRALRGTLAVTRSTGEDVVQSKANSKSVGCA